MELFLLAVVIVIIAIFVSRVSMRGVERTEVNTSTYLYSRKDAIMTDAEAKFFHRLQNISEGKYYVFPQIHLSSLLKNETKGKYWKAAFQRINRTSVDYVLAHKETLQVAYAVELDDWSHDNEKRHRRDSSVAAMLGSVNIPLVRFRNVTSMSDDDIMNVFRDAKKDN